MRLLESGNVAHAFFSPQNHCEFSQPHTANFIFFHFLFSTTHKTSLVLNFLDVLPNINSTIYAVGWCRSDRRLYKISATLVWLKNQTEKSECKTPLKASGKLDSLISSTHKSFWTPRALALPASCRPLPCIQSERVHIFHFVL